MRHLAAVVLFGSAALLAACREGGRNGADGHRLGTAVQAAVQVPKDSVADLVLGQAGMTYNWTDRVDARGFGSPTGVAVDDRSTPVRLYVSDFTHSRVLAWADALGFANYAPADKVFGQANFSEYSANRGGTAPGADTLYRPNGIAVDPNGNLLVADMWNNRVLVYFSPFAAGGDEIADQVFGQPNFSTATPNPIGSPTETSLNMPIGVDSDSSGNIFVADRENHRILRYPAASLDAGAPVVADLVLGQPNMNSSVAQCTGSGLNQPWALHVDRAASPNRLLVADTMNMRVVNWPLSALSNGKPFDGARVFGQPDAVTCESQVVSASSMRLPVAVETDPLGNVYVADRARVLEFDAPFSPGGNTAADKVFGKPVFSDDTGCTKSTATGTDAVSICSANGLAWTQQGGGHLFVADGLWVMAQGKLWRVLRFDAPFLVQGDDADAILGAPHFTSITRNGIGADGMNAPVGIAIDFSVTPGRLFVAESGNHRVLGWADVTGFASGAPADWVIGQPSGLEGLAGAAANRLRGPQGVAVDSLGRVYVADTFNNRVVRFAPPFSVDGGADLVLGQSDFLNSSCSATVTAQDVCSPTGVAVSPTGALFVSDTNRHRVLAFLPPLTSGMAASVVIGQPDFGSGAANRDGGAARDTLKAPRHLSLETWDGGLRLYVADIGNDRVLAFDDPLGALPAAALPDAVLGHPDWDAGTCVGTTASNLCGARGVVSDGFGNVYVADNASRVVRFYRPDGGTFGGSAVQVFGQYNYTSSGANNGGLNGSSLNNPNGLARDSLGALYVADTSNNRVLVYFGNQRPLVTDAGILPTTPDTASNLQAAYQYVETDTGEAVTAQFRWYFRRDFGPWQDAGAADGGWVPASATERGDQWFFTVRLKDPYEFGPPASSPVVTVGNAIPRAVDAGVSSVAPRSDQDVMALYTFQDADQPNDSDHSRVVWYRLEDGGFIRRASGVVLTTAQTSKGEVWKFEVTPNDGIQDGVPVESPILTVRNSPPRAIGGSIRIQPLAPKFGDTLVATYAPYTDVDGDSAVIGPGKTTIRWYRDNGGGFQLQSAYNDATQVPGSAVLSGHRWYFTIRLYDGTDWDPATVSSNTVDIDSVAPVATDVQIVPTPAYRTSNLGVTYTFQDPDDGGESDSGVRWYLNDAGWDAGVGVPSPYLVKGQNWVVGVTPCDTSAKCGFEVFSSPVWISNSTPTARDAGISPTTASTLANLTANYEFVDVDVGDVESAGTSVVWYLGGNRTAYTGKMLSSAVTAKGQSWSFGVQVHDGTDQALTELISPPRLIANSLPSALDAGILSPTYTVTESLRVAYEHVDVDNVAPESDPPVAPVVAWYLDGGLRSDLADAGAVSVDKLRKGQVWTYQLRPCDSEGCGAWATSKPATVRNSRPQALGVGIDGGATDAGYWLAVSYQYFDSDNDSQNVPAREVTWARNTSGGGGAFEEEPSYSNSLSIPVGVAKKGEWWRAMVRVHDGEEIGEWFTSPGFAVGNSPPTVTDGGIVVPGKVGLPRRGDALKVLYEFTDPDGDLEDRAQTVVRWYQGAVPTPWSEEVVLAGGDVLAASQTVKGQQWRAEVVPSDGASQGDGRSFMVTIQNTPPVARPGTYAPIEPTPVNTTILPAGEASVKVPLQGDLSTDADGDTLVFSWYEFYLGPSPRTLVAQGTNVYAYLPPGTHRLTLEVFDGTDKGTADVEIVINNPKPTVTSPGSLTAAPGWVSLSATALDSIGRGLKYSWSQTSGEPVLQFLDAQKATARVFALSAGERRFELAVVAGTAAADPVGVTVTMLDAAPWAHAPARQVRNVGEEWELSSVPSSDPNGEALTYQWSLKDAPAGTILFDATAATARVKTEEEGVFPIELVVRDRASVSVAARTELVVVNDSPRKNAPVAVAGPVGVAEVGLPIVLEGRGSYDLEGDVLTYFWRRVDGAAGDLFRSDSPTPTFTARESGKVTLGLWVFDGSLASPEKTVVFEVDDGARNRRPVARVKGVEPVTVTSEVQLDGTISSDPDGATLAYLWTQTEGVAVTLDSRTSALARFAALRPGYVAFELVVVDEKGVASLPARVSVSVTSANNHAPVANAGPDVKALVTDTAHLDGSASIDADGDALRFEWEQVFGNPVVLSSAGPQPAFRPRGKGTYRFRLRVWDSEAPSGTDEVDVLVRSHGDDNHRPVAVIAGDTTGRPGVEVVLDGSGSTDEDPLDTLGYEWSLAAFPSEKEPKLADTHGPSLRFVPELVGTYTVALKVNDGDLVSEAVYATVLVSNGRKPGCGGCSGLGASPLGGALLAWILVARRRRR